MLNVLVIEDDHIMLRAITNILNKGGYNVLTAKDGKQAFQLLEEAAYDVVITDIMLPYANGLQVVSKIRKDSTKKNVGIIVVSSIGYEDTIVEAFELGADDYLKKPILAGELLSRVRKVNISRKKDSEVNAKNTIADHNVTIASEGDPNINTVEQKTELAAETPIVKEAMTAIKEPVPAVTTTGDQESKQQTHTVVDDNPSDKEPIVPEESASKEQIPVVDAGAPVQPAIEEPKQEPAINHLDKIPDEPLLAVEALVAKEVISVVQNHTSVQPIVEEAKQEPAIAHHGSISDKPAVIAEEPVISETIAAVRVQDPIPLQPVAKTEEPVVKETIAAVQVQDPIPVQPVARTEEPVVKEIIAAVQVQDPTPVQPTARIEKSELKKEPEITHRDNISDKQAISVEEPVAKEVTSIAQAHASDQPLVEETVPGQETTTVHTDNVSDKPGALEKTVEKEVTPVVESQASTQPSELIQEVAIVHPDNIPDTLEAVVEKPITKEEATTVQDPVVLQPVIKNEKPEPKQEPVIVHPDNISDKQATSTNNPVVKEAIAATQDLVSPKQLKKNKAGKKTHIAIVPAPKVERRKKSIKHYDDPDLEGKKNDKQVIYLNVGVVIFVAVIIVIGILL